MCAIRSRSFGAISAHNEHFFTFYYDFCTILQFDGLCIFCMGDGSYYRGSSDNRCKRY